MAEEPKDGASSQGLSREQKIGFALLLIFAMMTITLGVLQIRNSLYAPFALGNYVPGDISSKIDPINALRYRDTDGDGLSDFDELYIYHTSPYLYDTYSLGMSDKQMIEKGLNPCPNGIDCSNPVISGVGSPVQNSVTSSLDENTMAVLSTSTALNLAQILSDPNQIRQLLIQNGMSSSTVAQISDSDLVTMVEETLNSTSTQNSLNQVQSLLQNAPTDQTSGGSTATGN